MKQTNLHLILEGHLQEFSSFYYKLLSWVTKTSVFTDIIVLQGALHLLKCVLLAMLITYENIILILTLLFPHVRLSIYGCFVQTAISDQGWVVTYSDRTKHLSFRTHSGHILFTVTRWCLELHFPIPCTYINCLQLISLPWNTADCQCTTKCCWSGRSASSKVAGVGSVSGYLVKILDLIKLQVQ